MSEDATVVLSRRDCLGSMRAAIAVGLGCAPLSIAASLVACTMTTTVPPPVQGRFALPDGPLEATSNLIIVGDIQRRLPIERFFREDNEKGTERVVRAIARESKSAVILLGDLVAQGMSKDDWRRFDQQALEIGAPILPVYGNHDLGGDCTAWLSRFPWFSTASWYEVRWGKVAFLFLDSNLEELDASSRHSQNAWYTDRLGILDRDVTVGAVVTVLHHAPFTENPNARADRGMAREAFVTPFCAGRKSTAMLSGHAHGYERYRRLCGGHIVSFIVSGGGGGPRPRLATPTYADDCLVEGSCALHERPLNYLRLEQTRFGFTITALAPLDDGSVTVFDSVQLPFTG